MYCCTLDVTNLQVQVTCLNVYNVSLFNRYLFVFKSSMASSMYFKQKIYSNI